VIKSSVTKSRGADHLFMARAIQLAQRGIYTTHPNPRVGCVIVRQDEIVGEGWHMRAGEAHAEVHALNAAAERSAAATVYVTLEPCSHFGRTPPCAEALVKAGVKRVVVAMSDPNPQVAGKGIAALRAAGIEVTEGVLQAEAVALNPGFISRFTRGRPFVRCKLAMSLDGRTAMASGESKWITSTAARRDVQRLRARSDAIMTGIGTMLADDPQLDVRPEGIDELHVVLAGEMKPPLRVIVDSTLRTPLASRTLGLPGRKLIATAVEYSEILNVLQQKRVNVCRFAGDDQRVNLPLLLDYLAALEINELMVEAGPQLSGAMLQAGLIDELVLYIAPHLMGDQAQGLMSLPGLEKMSQRITLETKEIRAVGDDWRITLRPAA